MPVFLSLRYSKMVSFFLSTTFSVTDVSPTRDSGTRDVFRRQFENILQNTLLLYCFRSYFITAVTFSVLVHQMYLLNPLNTCIKHVKNVRFRISFQFWRNVLKSSESDIRSMTSLGRPQGVNLIIIHKIGF